MHRIQFNVDDTALQAFCEAKKASKSSTRTATILKAVGLLQIVADHTNAGGKVILEDKNGKQEVMKIL